MTACYVRLNIAPPDHIWYAKRLTAVVVKYNHRSYTQTSGIWLLGNRKPTYNVLNTFHTNLNE